MAPSALAIVGAPYKGYVEMATSTKYVQWIPRQKYRTLTQTYRAAPAALIDIYVGRKRKHYRVHRELLFSKSAELEELCSRHTDARDGSVYLRNEFPGAFDLLVNWLYRGTITPVDGMAPLWAWAGHGELYSLAERWGMTDVQNGIMDRIMQQCLPRHVRLGAEHIRLALASMKPHSPLRRFIIELTAHFFETSHPFYERKAWLDFANIGGDFMCDVLLIMKMSRGVVYPASKPYCDFHVHEDGKRCDEEK